MFEMTKSEFNFDFPKNPFEDINPSDFNKLNKKEVTEDFVGENFRVLGWEVYKPFTDTGIDRIIIKHVCPKGHTALDQNLKNKKCPTCDDTPIEIIRFIQVKTRKIVNNIFGFTLKPKDIRIDPRHIYLLYSDNTTEDKQDFRIVPVNELLSFFISVKINPFSSKSFRTGNNKLNSLKYNPDKNIWSWNGSSWEKFRNVNGLKLLQKTQIDLNIKREINSTRINSNKLQHTFSKGSSYTDKVENAVNEELKKRMSLYSNKKNILEIRKNVDSFLDKNCSYATLESSRKYFENIKFEDILGDDSDE